MSPRLSLCGVAEMEGRFLVARRNPGGSQGGKWEFPGGKHEMGETSQQALAREFLEELGVEVQVHEKVFTGSFRNGEKEYVLEAWRITLESLRFQLCEHQEVRWVAPQEMSLLDFSDSDRLVCNHLLKAK